jgi:hypothetical protein
MSPIAEIRTASSNWAVLERNVINITLDDGSPAVGSEYSVWVDNWVRLGLYEATFTEYMVYEGAYDWVRERPEFLRHTSRWSPVFERGILGRTSFGEQFALAIGAGPLLVQQEDVAPEGELVTEWDKTAVSKDGSSA